jgi:ParB-like chromosome segregation protein Spo0J
MSELAVHPVAALSPMLADDELEELAADIKERGLLQPIVLDVEGRVLDGRNRLAACKMAGVEPQFVTWADGDSAGYALAVNIARRHLRPAARYLIIEQARQLNGGTQQEYTELYNVRQPRLAEAAIVLGYKDLFDEIFADLLSLESAAKTARQRNADAAAKKEKKERLKQCAPDLYGLVEENRHDIDEALAALKCREAKALAEAEATKEKARAKMEADARRSQGGRAFEEDREGTRQPIF